MEGWNDSLLIDHPRGFGVAPVVCSQKVGINKYRGNNIREILIAPGSSRIYRELDVAGHIGAHPSGRNQFRDWLASVDGEVRRFGISR